MDKIIWSSDFSVGDDTIDKQHHTIIELINALSKHHNENAAPEIIESAIHDIVKYSTSHLEYEEKILKKLEYPNYFQHKELHFSYTEQLSELTTAIMGFENREIINRLLIFLNDWWSNHILKEDMAYKPFL